MIRIVLLWAFILFLMVYAWRDWYACRVRAGAD